MARTFRSTHYEERPELFARAIPIFQALIEDDHDDQFHRNHGQLSLLYKNLQPPPTPISPIRPASPTEQKHKRARLVNNDIPAGKIADVNLGILLPLASLVTDMKFTLEIDVTGNAILTEPI